MLKFDCVITYGDLSGVPKNLMGIYFLYNIHDELVYIGKAKDLKGRLKSHFEGTSDNSCYFSHHFHYAKLIYMDEEKERASKEKEFIKEFKPIFNTMYMKKSDSKAKDTYYLLDDEMKSSGIIPKSSIKDLKKEILESHGEEYEFFIDFGLNSYMLISDIAKITANDIEKNKINVNFKRKYFYQDFIHLNHDISRRLAKYIKRNKIKAEDSLFPTIKEVDTQTLFSILNETSQKIGLNISIGEHSFRKTFGQFWVDNTKNISLIHRIFGHGSGRIGTEFYELTFDYIEATEQQKEEIYNLQFEYEKIHYRSIYDISDIDWLVGELTIKQKELRKAVNKLEVENFSQFSHLLKKEVTNLSNEITYLKSIKMNLQGSFKRPSHEITALEFENDKRSQENITSTITTIKERWSHYLDVASKKKYSLFY